MSNLTIIQVGHRNSEKTSDLEGLREGVNRNPEALTRRGVFKWSRVAVDFARLWYNREVIRASTGSDHGISCHKWCVLPLTRHFSLAEESSPCLEYIKLRRGGTQLLCSRDDFVFFSPVSYCCCSIFFSVVPFFLFSFFIVFRFERVSPLHDDERSSRRASQSL